MNFNAFKIKDNKKLFFLCFNNFNITFLSFKRISRINSVMLCYVMLCLLSNQIKLFLKIYYDFEYDKKFLCYLKVK